MINSMNQLNDKVGKGEVFKVEATASYTHICLHPLNLNILFYPSDNV